MLFKAQPTTLIGAALLSLVVLMNVAAFTLLFSNLLILLFTSGLLILGSLLVVWFHYQCNCVIECSTIVKQGIKSFYAVLMIMSVSAIVVFAAFEQQADASVINGLRGVYWVLFAVLTIIAVLLIKPMLGFNQELEQPTATSDNNANKYGKAGYGA